MPRIRDALDLDLISSPSTRCKAFDRLEMAVWGIFRAFHSRTDR
jgi:hypothetical protein